MRLIAFLPVLLWVCALPLTGQVTPGDARFDEYLPLLEGQRVGIVCNHTAVVVDANGHGTHLVDTLLKSGVNVAAAFGPEHGFRGDLPDGAHAPDGTDPATGIAVYSLYGTYKKPPAAQLANVDIVLFDIQDVGVRCYTYLSTLILVMEACAEQDIPVIVLDRPNPNGHLVDGPVLDTAAVRSFVGFLPIPLAHGMTLGELAEMANGEGWLGGGYSAAPDPKLRCDLTVIDCKGWTRNARWTAPIAPSPNLPTPQSVRLYPHLVLLEATIASVGRGTSEPFTKVGFPGFVQGPLSFTPAPNAASRYPKHANQACQGFSMLRRLGAWQAQGVDNRLKMEVLQELHQAWLNTPAGDQNPFIDRPQFFDQLAGGPELRLELERNADLKGLQNLWGMQRARFMEMRSGYLRYPTGS
ncbi:MAG TPA: DUF1343 domain-containing protein [Flavobacteriales bacterium]|jgi:uncharacterized protein YbbC (DUF1343 family)|nr:DUF1343 domain-containing protein [Flavobacteriales bacterium]